MTIKEPEQPVLRTILELSKLLMFSFQPEFSRTLSIRFPLTIFFYVITFGQTFNIFSPFNFSAISVILLYIYSTDIPTISWLYTTSSCHLLFTVPLRKSLSIQSMAQIEVPWEGVTLNRCLFIAITILVLSSGCQRLHGQYNVLTQRLQIPSTPQTCFSSWYRAYPCGDSFWIFLVLFLQISWYADK